MTLHAPKILVVDDNEQTVRIVQFALERAGYTVKTALSGESALAQIKEDGLPDLAIVDYNMLPGMSGPEFCQKIHVFCDLPVIMLTAVDDEKIVEACLCEYCEDYVRKPFSPTVLVARVRRLLARFENLGAGNTVFVPVDDRLTVNFSQQTATVDGEPVLLTPIETKLLHLLMRQADKPVHTDYILRRIWPQEDAYEDRLHVHIHRLRQKIEHKADGRYIESKRGTGYIFRTH
ncbi:MAG: response regulator transcription factor [Chloroflexi bacterium]|nr:response regulator transcription factor [Chloroflexota bacterium]